jgi:hypothetical protein
MSRHGYFLFTVSLGLVISFTTACGSSRQLQSISVSPSSADAKNYPKGQVQFTATGIYSASPTKATLSSISWCASPAPGACVGQNVKAGATISQNGLAQCDAGSAGTWTINASSPPTQASQPGGEMGVPILFGSATLTCP